MRKIMSEESIVRTGPLVSIIVITYNSAKYVLETLESAKAQTYQNIELIISDDGSKDDTLNLCKRWINNNSSYFNNEITVVSSGHNTGTTENCKRGVAESNGCWVKLIAGDDVLMSNALQDMVDCVNAIDTSTVGAILTQEVRFSNLEESNSTHQIFPEGNDLSHPFYAADSKEQFQWLLLGKFVSGVSIYYKTKLIKEHNILDCSISLLVEDYLAAVYLTSLGYRIHFLEKPTVFYRKQGQGITAKDNAIFPKYYSDVLSVKRCFSKEKSVGFIVRVSVYWDFVSYRIVLMLGNSGNMAMFFYYLFKKTQPGKLFSLKYNLSI